jgi:hypothetical protein
LQKHLSSLLDWQKIYLKHRGTIKWVTSGDAYTKFFHANATIRHRQNLIAILADDKGNRIHKHEEKETTLWNAYKKGLGPQNTLICILISKAFYQPLKI